MRTMKSHVDIKYKHRVSCAATKMKAKKTRAKREVLRLVGGRTYIKYTSFFEIAGVLKVCVLFSAIAGWWPSKSTMCVRSRHILAKGGLALGGHVSTLR